MEGSPRSVLLVEDEPLLGNLLKQRLEKEGFKVILNRDGAEALKTLKDFKPDLILLDIILPKVSGFEFMETIRNDPQFQRAPIIIVSNLGQESDVTKGQSLGAVGYLVKAQVSIEEIIEKVKEFLKND